MAAQTPTPAHARIRQSLAGCMTDRIGAGGLDAATLAAWTARTAPALDGLKAAYRDGSLPLLRIAEETADLAAARAALDTLSAGARTILFFGTGGSSLGGQTLAQVAGWNIPGGADAGQRKRPRTRFYDNLDARTLERSLAELDLASTRFVVTTKSGTTPETLAQAVFAVARAREAGLDPRHHFLGLTEPARPGVANGLRALLEPFGCAVLDHHTGIGGRFSCLTNVGLLPAIARGLDAAAVRAGARSVVADMLAAARPTDFAPAVSAAAAVALAAERGVKVHVMMPYDDRLGRLGHWFAQLWAESLGKDGKGTAPVACLGPLDQHSQLQLFMDGPREHLISIVRVAPEGGMTPLDADLARRAGLGFMAGRTVADLVAAQGQAVPDALASAGRPVRTIDLDHLDETAIGALLMHLMIETILAGRLMGIDPFDQPAVELAKRLTRERLT